MPPSEKKTFAKTSQPNSPPNSKSPLAKELLDRKDRYVTDLIKRFSLLAAITAAPIEEGATKERAAAQALQMEVETAALVEAAENLLKLTRELKEMWLFGPLRDIGEGEGEGKMDEDSKAVGQMVETLLNKRAEGDHD